MLLEECRAAGCVWHSNKREADLVLSFFLTVKHNTPNGLCSEALQAENIYYGVA